MLHTMLARFLESRTEQMTERSGLHLVGGGDGRVPGVNRRIRGHALGELAGIAARRCSAFFAEAAVLVLVFGVLDFLIQHGHVGGGWVLGVASISVALLVASVGTEFSARRWLGAQP